MLSYDSVSKYFPLKDYISVPLFMKEFEAIYLVFLSEKKYLNMLKGSYESVKYFQTMFKPHFLHEFFPVSTHWALVLSTPTCIFAMYSVANPKPHPYPFSSRKIGKKTSTGAWGTLAMTVPDLGVGMEAHMYGVEWHVIHTDQNSVWVLKIGMQPKCQNQAAPEWDPGF